MEKRRKKKGKGRKTGEIKNLGRAGGDGKGEKAGASAKKCFQNGARFPRETGPNCTSS